jgi:hypothetical protein
MAPSAYPENLGFRAGSKGTHTSRTMMLDELGALLGACPPDSPRSAYIAAAIDGNALGKRTVATRKLTLQRLSELYCLDPSEPLFRVLRHLWSRDRAGLPLLAILCSLSRDPLLRVTSAPVLSMRVGEELSRQVITDSLRSQVGDRLNDSTLDKVVRNVSSSWCQSGHLEGRVRKFRRRVQVTPGALTYAIVLGFLQGLRGTKLFDSEWTQVLDSSPGELRQLALEAKRLGYLDLKIAGEIIEIGLSSLLNPKEILQSRGTH